MKDLIYYLRINFNADRNRLWRLLGLLFVIGTALFVAFMPATAAIKAPLYAALAATAFAAERIPTKPISQFPVIHLRGRVYLVAIDLWTSTWLEVMAGVATLMAASYWLRSTEAGPIQSIVGMIIVAVGGVFLLRTLVSRVTNRQ